MGPRVEILECNQFKPTARELLEQPSLGRVPHLRDQSLQRNWFILIRLLPGVLDKFNGRGVDSDDSMNNSVGFTVVAFCFVSIPFFLSISPYCI